MRGGKLQYSLGSSQNGPKQAHRSAGFLPYPSIRCGMDNVAELAAWKSEIAHISAPQRDGRIQTKPGAEPAKRLGIVCQHRGLDRQPSRLIDRKQALQQLTAKGPCTPGQEELRASHLFP